MISADSTLTDLMNEEGASGALLPASSTRDYLTLMKPGVMMLVVFTGWAGVAVAPGTLHPFLQLVTVIAIALGSGAGAAINMWFDRDIDAIMRRTQKRPIPSGLVPASDAATMGIMLGVAAVATLGLAVNWLAAGILAFAIFFYGVVYTMLLKRSTPQNIVIGGAAGAFPPVIGWAAVTGDVTLMPLLLFTIVFLWTPPHFWALALYRNEDYTRAGVPMLPVTAGLKATKEQMWVYTWLLGVVSMAPAMLHYAGPIYGVGALALNVQFLRHCWKVMHSDDDKPARAMFGFSILYLFALFGALVVDHWIWG